MSTPITFQQLHRKLIQLSNFRWFPTGYLRNQEQQRIVFQEWLENGESRPIKNPLRWLEIKTGKKSVRDQFIAAYIYNEVPILHAGIRLHFHFTRIRGTDKARIYGDDLFITPYTQTKGIITEERRKVRMMSGNAHLYKVTHSLPTLKHIFQTYRQKIKSDELY